MILYDKLVIARGKIKNYIYFNIHHHVVVNEKLSWFFFHFLISHWLWELKGSHIKWWHVLRTFLNIFKKFTKPKPMENVPTWFSIFCKSNDFFLQKISDQIFPFHIYFSYLCKFSNQKKKLVMTCVFECFQSHCHILKELHEILCLIGAITIIGKNSFIFSFVDYDWWQSHLGLGAHLRRW